MEYNKAIDSMANVLRMLDFDVDNDPHFKETPKRFVTYLLENGCAPTYKDHNCDKTFEDISCFRDNISYSHGFVIHTAIPFSAICPHHLLPYYGHVAVAYSNLNEDGRRLTPGFSKIARIVARNSKRAYTQEIFTHAIVKDISELPSITAAAVVVVARHSCIENRGVEAVGAKSITDECVARVPGSVMRVLRGWAISRVC